MTFEEGINHITNAFMEMLNLSEDLFGKIDNYWTFIGVEIRDDGPNIMYYPNNKISIVLKKSCSYFFPTSLQLYFQMAHETCHLLYPTGKADSNILNEGISTYFSKYYQELKYPESTYAIDCIKNSKYYESYQLVDKLLSIDKDAIKKIRKKIKDISNITEEELKYFNFGLSDNEIKLLAKKF